MFTLTGSKAFLSAGRAGTGGIFQGGIKGRNDLFISGEKIAMVTKILRCKKCGSKEISQWNGAGTAVIYTCKFCGYKGPEVMSEFIRPGMK
jgi:predicted RNA-binding Zn-ribbon protein involved in translation (DUF1610 family)